MKIGLLSDTHGFLDPKIFSWFETCDEIWHAGDWGDPETTYHLLTPFKPIRGVYGNIDGQYLRKTFPEFNIWETQGLKIFMTHICGYPGRWAPRISSLIRQEKPGLVIGGHSHILKVMPDPANPGMLFMNPGAAGKHGFHQVRTALRFDILHGKPANLELIEMGSRT